MQSRRTHIPDITGNYDFGDRSHKQCRTITEMNQQLRAPFAVLVQNSHNINKLSNPHHVSVAKEMITDGKSPQLKTFLFVRTSSLPEKYTRKRSLISIHKQYWPFSVSQNLDYDLTRLVNCYLLFAAQNDKYQGSFLRKDDPKINALMQQAELLSSLALKVNAENTDQSLENAWKVRKIPHGSY